MFDNVLIFNFSGVYDEESFYLKDKGSSFYDTGTADEIPSIKFYDMKDISGTNCMCDDMAVESIRDIFKNENVTPYGIHFIDSGNYHYMSALLTEMVKEPFSLVVLDHHPDMQPPMFGDILSCGGWVLKVLNENKYVRDVHVIGADEVLVSKLNPEDARKAKFYSVDESECLDANRSENADGKGINIQKFELDTFSTEYPVYLSIDKDVLLKSEVITNWDQGNMTSSQFFLLVKKLAASGKLLGVDICGECATDQEDCDVGKAIAGNDEFNRRIMGFLIGA